jgi:hypothetical protein
VKTESGPKAFGIPPSLERLPSAEEKTRVVRFEVSPATMLHLVLVVACL